MPVFSKQGMKLRKDYVPVHPCRVCGLLIFGWDEVHRGPERDCRERYIIDATSR